MWGKKKSLNLRGLQGKPGGLSRLEDGNGCWQTRAQKKVCMPVYKGTEGLLERRELGSLKEMYKAL